jgi:hypothetical protein
MTKHSGKGKGRGGIKIGRDAGTGQFERVKVARAHPKTAIVQTIRKRPRNSPAR